MYYCPTCKGPAETFQLVRLLKEGNRSSHHIRVVHREGCEMWKEICAKFPAMIQMREPAVLSDL